MNTHSQTHDQHTPTHTQTQHHNNYGGIFSNDIMNDNALLKMH